MLATESKNMVENIELVISDTVVSAEQALGHKTLPVPNGQTVGDGDRPLEMKEDMQMEDVEMEQ
jgi:hypothetical protein